MTSAVTVADRVAAGAGCGSLFVRPRCHACGDPAIAALCCVCQHLLCSRHDRRADLAGLRPRRRRGPIAAVEEPGRDGAGDEPPTAVDGPRREDAVGHVPLRTIERHFCRDCEPAAHGRDIELAAACAQVAVGAVLMVATLWLGALLMLVGLVRLVWHLVVGHRRRREVRRRYQTVLLLDPRISRLRVVETVSVTQGVPSDDRPAALSVRGHVELDVAWSRSHTAQITEWRRRVRQDQAGVPISSGAVLLHGPARIQFVVPGGRERESRAPVLHYHPAVLPLRPLDNEHPALADEQGRGDPRWEIRGEYVLEDPAVPADPPVWVTPALAPGSGGRALDIEVQWCLHNDRVDHVEAAPRAEQIEECRLVVPAAWGQVRNATRGDQVTVSLAADGTQTIEWRRPVPAVEKAARGRYHFSVSFDHVILPESATIPAVTAFVVMEFQGALSGAKGVRVHAAGGARRQDGAASRDDAVKTRVELEAHLDLGSLRHQAVRAVPDPRRDGDRPPQVESRRFPGVAPDHHTVALLTDLLSDQGYYVKRVVENPAQPGRSPDLMSRFWDIAGRRYNGVHPIDFHLLLLGDQARAGSEASSTTTVRLDLHGTFANKDMERRIVEEYDELWARVDSSISAKGRDDGRERPGGIPIDTASAEVRRLRSVALTVRRRLRNEHGDDGIRAELAAELIAVIDREFGLDVRTG